MQPVPTRIPGRPAPSPITPYTRSSGASRCRLRLAARHAMEHPPADTLSCGPGCFRHAAPTVPSCPRFSPLLVPIPKRMICPAALESRARGSDQQGRRRGPGLELRSTGGSRPGAAPGAGRATAAGQPGKRSSGCARWQHRDRTPAPASGGSPDDALASQGPSVESRAMCASALLGRWSLGLGLGKLGRFCGQAQDH